MRLIDADHLRRWILSRVFKTQLSVADIIDQIDREDTIEPDPDTVSRQAARMCLTGDVTDMSIEQYIKMVDERLKQLPPSPTPNAPKTLDTDTQHVQDVECVGDDTVSRKPETTTEIQKILDYLDNELHPLVSPDNWYVYSELYDMVSELKNLPPTPSRPKWIPCSKRLPEVGAVLITDGNEILIGEYHVDSTWSVDGCDYNPDLEKIAWMPLPEPYKGAEQSKSTHA